MKLFKKTLLATAILATSLNVCAEETEVPNLENIEFQHKLELIKKDIDSLNNHVVSNKELGLKQSDINYKLIDDLKIEINALEKYVYNLPNTSNYEQVKDDLKEQISANNNNISHWGNIAGILGALITLFLVIIGGLHFNSIRDSTKKVKKLIDNSEKEQILALDKTIQKSITNAKFESQNWLDKNGKVQLQEHIQVCSNSLNEQMKDANLLIKQIEGHVKHTSKLKQEASDELIKIKEMSIIPQDKEDNTNKLDATTTAIINSLKEDDLIDFVSNYIEEAKGIVQINEILSAVNSKIDEKANVVFLILQKSFALIELSQINKAIDALKEVIEFNYSGKEHERINGYKSVAVKIMLYIIKSKKDEIKNIDLIKSLDYIHTYISKPLENITFSDNKTKLSQASANNLISLISICNQYHQNNELEKAKKCFLNFSEKYSKYVEYLDDSYKEEAEDRIKLYDSYTLLAEYA